MTDRPGFKSPSPFNLQSIALTSYPAASIQGIPPFLKAIDSDDIEPGQVLYHSLTAT